jgi:hypothetical protein
MFAASPRLVSSPLTPLGTSPAPVSTTRNHPISLRIYKSVGVSFDDPSSYSALQTASSFYSSQVSPSPLTNGASASTSSSTPVPRIKSPSESTSEPSTEVGEAFTLRRTMKGQSASTARKFLKKDVEARLASGSSRFLEAFGEVDQKLTVLRDQMEEMKVRCDQVQNELDTANGGTRWLLERADGLRSQRSVSSHASCLRN